MYFAIFLSIVGTIGMVVSSFTIVITQFHREYLGISSIIFGIAFLLASCGYKLQDQAPRKAISISTLAMEEYHRCLNSYNGNWLLKHKKVSKEQYCSNLNIVYKKNVLGVK